MMKKVRAGANGKFKVQGQRQEDGVKVSLDFFFIGSYNSYWRGKCTW